MMLTMATKTWTARVMKTAAMTDTKIKTMMMKARDDEDDDDGLVDDGDETINR